MYSPSDFFSALTTHEKLRSGLISKYSNHLIKIASEVAVNKREEMIINGDDYDTEDGTAVRDYIHVSDLSSAHLASLEYLLTKKKNLFLNLSNGLGYSVLEVINTANRITGNKIKFEYAAKRPGDAEKLISNVNKLHKYINWKPRFDDLDFIIKTAISWEKKIYEKDL